MSGDFTRCHDAACPERRECRRWLERESGWERTSHVATLRQVRGPCVQRIPASAPLEPVVERLADGAIRVTVGSAVSTVSSEHLVEERVLRLQRLSRLASTNSNAFVP